MATPTAVPAAPAAPAAAIISIEDHTPNPDNNLYDVTFLTETHHHYTITTTVTADPSVVSAWITTFLISPSASPIIGLDVEWRPNFSRNSDNAVATLQLCTSTDTSTSTYTCLIFQILHCRSPLPKVLIDLLANRLFTFVGVGIESDVEKLIGDYGLSVANMVDLGMLAKQMRLRLQGSTVGLKGLARVVMGVEVAKPKRVTMSRWDQGWLSYPQIQYACVDAFLSFQIGTLLMGLPGGASSSQ